jgi:C-terminal processing protease CtpA/Prc
MEVIDLLPVWLLAVAMLLAMCYAVRSGWQPRLRRVPRILAVTSLTLTATALPAWAASLVLAESLPEVAVALFWVGLAVPWMLAADGLLRTGALLRGMALVPRRKPVLAGALASALIVPLWGMAGERVEYEKPDADRTPYAFAHELRKELEDYYPHWETAPVTLDALWSAHHEELMAEAAACQSDGGDPDEPCIGLLRVLSDMFAELRNGHTWLGVHSDLGYPEVRPRPVSDGVVIDRVKDGSEAERLGLDVGMEIVAVNGLPLEEAARRTPAGLTAHVSGRTREYAALRYALVGYPRSPVTLNVEDADGLQRTVKLTRVPAFEANDDQAEDEDEESRIEGHLVGESFGYISLGGFQGEELVEKFDRLLDEAFETRGLILDLRDNRGGLPEVGAEVLGRFFSKPVQLSKDCERSEWEEEALFCKEQWVEPRAPVFPRPVAVLINEESVSAAEIVAYALCRVGNARCFGRTTAGESDAAFSREIPGGVIQLSVADTRPTVGPSLLGAGVVPHEIVELTIADLRAGRDPTYRAARRWIRGQQDRSTRPPAP